MTQFACLKRVILSIYFYDLKRENRAFFDAWWQFITTLSYVSSMVVSSLIHTLLFLFDIKHHYLFSIGPFILAFLFQVATNEYRNTQFFDFVIKSQEELQPVSRWMLYCWFIVVLTLFVLSFALVV